MSTISETEQQVLAKELNKINKLASDIEINTLIQDRKYMDILERMTEIATSCRAIAIVMGSLELRKQNESTSPRKVS